MARPPCRCSICRQACWTIPRRRIPAWALDSRIFRTPPPWSSMWPVETWISTMVGASGGLIWVIRPMNWAAPIPIKLMPSAPSRLCGTLQMRAMWLFVVVRVAALLLVQVRIQRRKRKMACGAARSTWKRMMTRLRASLAASLCRMAASNRMWVPTAAYGSVDRSPCTTLMRWAILVGTAFSIRSSTTNVAIPLRLWIWIRNATTFRGTARILLLVRQSHGTRWMTPLSTVLSAEPAGPCMAGRTMR